MEKYFPEALKYRNSNVPKTIFLLPILYHVLKYVCREDLAGTDNNSTQPFADNRNSKKKFSVCVIV